MVALKVAWIFLILTNVYDVVLSAMWWLRDGLSQEENYFIWYVSYYGVNVSPPLALAMLISIKLLFFVGVYWYTKLFDLLKIGKYKWISLLPFIAITIFIVDLHDTLYFFQ